MPTALLGSVAVANTMVASILERRREIGLRRALAASRGQILTESVLPSARDGLIGTVIGVLATVGYTVTQGWPPIVVVPLAAAGGFGGAVGLALYTNG